MLELIPPPKSEDDVKQVQAIQSAPAEVIQLALPLNSESEESLPVPTTPVRVLTEAEIEILKPIFAEQNADLPDPRFSFFVGSVTPQGEVTSFLVIQIKTHAQPMWIKPGHEGIFRSLVHAAEKVIQERTGGNVWVYLFAPEGKISRMAERAKMFLEPWKVYSKMVPPAEVPAKEMQPDPSPTSKPKRVPIWQRDEESKESVQ